MEEDCASSLQKQMEQLILHICSGQDRKLLTWGETRANWTSERLFNAKNTKALE